MASERRQQSLVATSVKLHETSSWHLKTVSQCLLVRVRSRSRIVFPLSAALLFCTLVNAQSPAPPLPYHSKSLNSLRRLTVYTSPRHEREPQTRYSVVYLLHGANADETAWVRLGHVNFILDNLLASAKIKPFIVVMPFGYGVTPGGPQAENTAKFGKDLVEDVIPYIEANYRTFSDCDRRAIADFSMGGGQALSIGLNNLDLFSHVAGFSSGLGSAANFPKTYASLIGQPETANRKIRMLWVGCGAEDGAFAASQGLSEFLTKHNIKHTLIAGAVGCQSSLRSPKNSYDKKETAWHFAHIVERHLPGSPAFALPAEGRFLRLTSVNRRKAPQHRPPELTQS